VFSFPGEGQAPSPGPTPYVSIQLAVRIEIIAWRFSVHFQRVPLIFTLACHYCLSFAVLFHLFDPQQAITLTFSSFAATYQALIADISWRKVQPTCRPSSHTSTATFISVTCLFLLIPSMLSVVLASTRQSVLRSGRASVTRTWLCK